MRANIIHAEKSCENISLQEVNDYCEQNNIRYDCKRNSIILLEVEDDFF